MTTRVRIHNNNVDGTYEAETLAGCFQQFVDQHPDEVQNAVHLEWLEGDMSQLEDVVRTSEALFGET